MASQGELNDDFFGLFKSWQRLADQLNLEGTSRALIYENSFNTFKQVAKLNNKELFDEKFKAISLETTKISARVSLTISAYLVLFLISFVLLISQIIHSKDIVSSTNL